MLKETMTDLKSVKSLFLYNNHIIENFLSVCYYLNNVFICNHFNKYTNKDSDRYDF